VLPDHRTVDAADVRRASQHHSHLKFTLQYLDDLRGRGDNWILPVSIRFRRHVSAATVRAVRILVRLRQQLLHPHESAVVYGSLPVGYVPATPLLSP